MSCTIVGARRKATDAANMASHSSHAMGCAVSARRLDEYRKHIERLALERASSRCLFRADG
jgi:hypothetical protein